MAAVIYGSLFVIAGTVLWMRDAHRPAHRHQLNDSHNEIASRPDSTNQLSSRAEGIQRLTGTDSLKETQTVQPQAAIDSTLFRSAPDEKQRILKSPAPGDRVELTPRGGQTARDAKARAAEIQVEDRIYAFLNRLFDRIEDLFYPERRPLQPLTVTDFLAETQVETAGITSVAPGKEPASVGSSSGQAVFRPNLSKRSEPMTPTLETVPLLVNTFRARARKFLWDSQIGMAVHAHTTQIRVATPRPTNVRSDSLARR